MRTMFKELERRLANVSGSALLLGVLALAIVPGLILSVQQVRKSRAEDVARLTGVIDQIVLKIDGGGIAQGLNRVKELKNTPQDNLDNLSLGIWSLANETIGASEAFGPAFDDNSILTEDRSVRWYRGKDERRYRIITRDITDISEKGKVSTTPFVLQAAMTLPQHAERRTWLFLRWVWFAYTSVIIVAILLYWHTNARLRRGINGISAAVDRFADGHTDARIELLQGAPETQALTNRLNPILGRLDRSISGMKLFAQNARHEICNPLIKARDVLNEASTVENAKEVAQVKAHLLQAERSVGAILRLLKLDAERGQAILLDPIDLSQVITDCIELAEAGLTQQNRQLDINLAPGVYLRASTEDLAILIGNLLENAKKYAPPNAQIAVQLTSDSERFRLIVANTGAFPEDIRDTAFEPFSRAKSVGAIVGSGLGLALVDRIAERYGLSATITSSDDIAEIVITGPVTDVSVLDEIQPDRPTKLLNIVRHVGEYPNIQK